MNKPFQWIVDEMCHSDFRRFCDRMINTLCEVNCQLDRDSFFASQTTCFYSIAYRPCYPSTSPADFIINYNHVNKSVTVYCNLMAIIPTVDRYINLNEFISMLEE